MNLKKSYTKRETNLAKYDTEEKENEKETRGEISDETANHELSVSYASDEQQARLKSVQVPEETLEGEGKNNQTEINEIEQKEIVSRALVLEDVQGEGAKNEPSASLGNDDGITTLKSEESPEDVQEKKETKGAEDDGATKRSQTANEALVQGIKKGKEIDSPNKIVEPEPSEPNASTDEILILRGEEETEGPEEEEHAKDQVTDDKITAKELSIEEDKKGDELEHLAKEPKEADAEESKQRSKEIEDDLGSSFEELQADSQESKNNLNEEPDIVEDNKRKEDLAMEGGSYKEVQNDFVETAKETKGETLESITPVAVEEDKKDLIIIETEVLVQPNDNQGEEIEHLLSKTVDTELGPSNVNNENITGLASEEHNDELLEEQQKDYASAENKEAATEGLEPEDQHEVNESVPNETEDAELFTSTVNEKEKDQPKEEEGDKEKLTEDEEAVQEAEQVPLDQFPNELKENEPSASNLNDDDTTILTCRRVM
ncbi:hypothetical protein QQ045_024172 [Rhodiola kirilowii]